MRPSPPERVADYRSRGWWRGRTVDALFRDAVAAHAPVVLDILGKPRVRSEDRELPWSPRCRRDVETMTEALILEADRRCPRLLPPESVLSHT